MELVQEMILKSNKGSSGDERTEMFQRVSGAVFCKICGKQYKERGILDGSVCTTCGRAEFIKGNFAEVLAGYIRLDKMGKLKEYYKQRTKKISGARMNTRRLVIWLLVKDGLMIPGDRKTEEIVYRCLWKKW
ncbi:MAG: hypothetical protein PHP08_00750 [Candidatus Dojkabacteria bacterium]|nr:hypothetical protein [Candidatus Dojkabacteria bacterium]